MIDANKPVKIRKSSEFLNQSNALGKIIQDRGINSIGYRYRVIFEDGTKNSYREEDLENINTDINDWKKEMGDSNV